MIPLLAAVVLAAAPVRARPDAGVVAKNVRMLGLAGGSHACLLEDGVVSCWGMNRYGQLGDGKTENKAFPKKVQLPAPAASVIAGAVNNCTQLVDGRLFCWGEDESFQGDKVAIAAKRTPTEVPDSAGLSAISLGLYTACGLRGGEVFCWGNGAYGLLGNGSEISSRTPVKVPGLSGVSTLTVGAHNACAGVKDGPVYCWGEVWGGLMPGKTPPPGKTDTTRPQIVSGVKGAVQLVIGEFHACALLASGKVSCWGGNGHAQLGAKEPKFRFSAEEVRISDVVSLGAGATHTCAITRDRTASCWGLGRDGELGGGAKDDSASPVKVKGLRDVVQVGGGTTQSCALLANGEVYCWGSNYEDALGMNGGEASATPVLLER